MEMEEEVEVEEEVEGEEVIFVIDPNQMEQLLLTIVNCQHL